MDYARNAAVLNEYLQWLQGEAEKRLQEYFNPILAAETSSAPPLIPPGVPSALPAAPQVSDPELPLPAFIREHDLDTREQLLLVLALAPHVYPVFFNELIRSYLPGNGDFPLLGGARGEQFRGLLPTGDTALFFLAGTHLTDRLQVQDLFREEHLFARYGVLRLERAQEGEPAGSGKVVLSPEYVDRFLTGTYTKPRFGPDFPAERITTNLNWDDLVLNAETLEQVLELKKWLRVKDKLLGTNKRMKPGYRVLFYGPPGTGKTLTACLLGKRAKEDGPGVMEHDVYRVDLSLVVSKFIGETEKNLSRLFDKAEHKNWILFFDEADSLFGKRTNVRDAHDKYANQEISYLLQRIEHYNGLVILASNFKTNIDMAFMRRFQSVVHFPMPGQQERLQFWQALFPAHLLEEKEQLQAVSVKYEISGASILNVAQSCFLKKMEEDGNILKISQEEMETAITREFNKEGKIVR